MNKHHRKAHIIFGIIFLLTASSCNTLDGDSASEFNNPEITFKSSGAWSSTKILKISQDKKAILLSSYPNLELKLTDEEYSKIVEDFKGFSLVTNERKVLCFDSPIFTISIIESGITKEKTFDGCYIGNESTAKPKFREILTTIVTSMEQIADSVYTKKAPWKGLEAEFSLNKEMYSVGEEIVAEYVIHNPTDIVREIWLEHNYPFSFRANPFDYEGDYFDFDYPSRRQIRESEPSKIILSPGETFTDTFSWDQTFENNGETQIPESQYMIRLGLTIYDFGSTRTLINILDE